MLNSEVPYVRCLIGWIVKTYDYFLYVVSSLPQSVCVGYVDHKRKRCDNTVDVVVCLHDRLILVPNVRHLRDLHTFSSVTSHELMIQ